jgi:hypothetical protein
MDLTKKEISFVGIPKELYNPKFETKIDITNFAYDGKVYTSRTTEDFFNFCGKCFEVLKNNDMNLNGCKTFTCQDFAIFDTHKDLFEATNKLQVIGILDIDQSTNKRFTEAFLRKWFEDNKSVVLLYTKNLKTITGFSPWFLEMLSLKEIK